jgi:hypothetical protein
MTTLGGGETAHFSQDVLRPLERDLHLHEDDVGSGPLDQGHGLLAVGRAAYDLHASVGGQQASEPIPKQCVVVGK